MGLLFLRAVAGMAIVVHGFGRLETGLPAASVLLEVLAMGAAVLLLGGLWTPIAASLVAVDGFWSAVSLPGDPLANILLAAIGVSLALLGPGAWSVDARLFGWKRIDVRDRTS